DQPGSRPDNSALRRGLRRPGKCHTTVVVHARLRHRVPTTLRRGLPQGTPARRTDVQERWAREFGVRPGDTLGLIAAIGRDTAGAATFAPPDELDGAMRSSGDVEPVTEPEIATRLRNLRTDPAAWHDLGEHWSLAGAQGKIALVRTADGWGYPRGSAPST